jgi:pre-rRNA-processing protein TSR2
MVSIIVDSFDPSQQTSQDGEPDDIYVEEQLLQMMNDEFDIVIEDGSAEPVARDIVRLWTSLASNTSGSEKSKAEGTVEEWEARAAKEKGKSVQAVVQENVEEVDADADDDWEDDDGSEDEEALDMDDSEPPQLIDNSRRKEKEEPIVDEDGFTMVQGKGKGRGHR